MDPENETTLGFDIGGIAYFTMFDAQDSCYHVCKGEIIYILVADGKFEYVLFYKDILPKVGGAELVYYMYCVAENSIHSTAEDALREANQKFKPMSEVDNG